MRHRSILAGLSLAALAWAGCRESTDPGRLALDVVDAANIPPTVGFSVNCTGLSCDFLDTSSDSDGVIVRYDWTFGDGGSDTVPNPQHTYAAAGSYDVFHAVVDDSGTVDSLHQVITVTADSGNTPPIAIFDFNCIGLTCQFTDLSVDTGGAVVHWEWFFGDGASETTQHPTHTYAAAGIYGVTLTVRDNEGAAGGTSRLVIVSDTSSNTPPIAIFDFTCTGLTCQFTDLSVDTGGAVVQWQWQFGDGASDTTQHPTHTYAVAGIYGVSLSVTDNEGATGGTSRLVNVSAPPIADTLVLIADGFRQKGVHHATLTWNRVTPDSFLVFRDSTVIAGLAGDTTYVDDTGLKGGHVTYVYRVCQVGGANLCSNVVPVSFGASP